MVKWLGTLVFAALTAFLVVALRLPNTVSRGDPAATDALVSVTESSFDPREPLAAFPSDFLRVMGYRPAVATGPYGRSVLIKPDGDCSGPLGPTGYDFDIVCKQHDLAYDVLRYAVEVDRPLPAWARKAADGLFARQLHARCAELDLGTVDAISCHTLAESYAVVCAVNGWRQGYHAPDHEPHRRWPIMGALFLELLALRPVHERARRLRLRNLLHRFDLPDTWPGQRVSSAWIRATRSRTSAATAVSSMVVTRRPTTTGRPAM